jgi:HPr kinase/phosphorylase
MLTIPVSQLLDESGDDLRLTQVAGGEAGLVRHIASARIQKPGLVLVGHTEGMHPDRVAVFGNTEMSFLATLDEEKVRSAVRSLVDAGAAALVVTKDYRTPETLKKEADQRGLAILETPLLSSNFIARVGTYLEDALAPSTSLHGVLIDVLGVGVLILGKSSIGKSEAALDLVLRGHRLVADDIVDVKRRGRSLHGQGSEIIKHHMEIRGLGIINIKDLFGVAAVRERKKIEMVCELVEWDPEVEYDRLGIDERTYEILDLTVPLLVIPVRPGRNMTTIIEVAARNHLLKLQGHHSAYEFQERLNRAIAEAGLAAPRQAPGDDVE